MPRTYTKRFRPGGPGSAKLEALGLQWLAEAPCGVRVASVRRQTDQLLEIEYFPPAAPAAGAAEAFGRALARTHAAGAAHFGAPPPNWTGPGWIGAAPMVFAAEPRQSWGEFYALDRVLPYARAAATRGALDPAGMDVIVRLAGRLADGLFDSPQPGLLGPTDAARLHGDLWAGNVLWCDRLARDQRWTGAALIDPAAHGGHAETDLAMLALFGLAGLETVTAAYDEVSALAEGWPDRVGLHQIYPLLVHAVLFGGSYGRAAVRNAARYL
ncbi:MAG: fructosamine kinase family protein [Bifidobacteriaceae bacterium]|nr:fructosamine kinase family protein [Bifidobacteriaceae bacterium]